MGVIVRNIKTNDAYLWLGGTRFRNMRTGKEGDVDEEKAKDVFKINIEATAAHEENPLVEELINSLNLKFDVNKQ